MRVLGNRKVQMSVAGTIAALSTLSACYRGATIDEEYSPSTQVFVKVNGQESPTVPAGSKLNLSYRVEISIHDTDTDRPSIGDSVEQYEWGDSDQTTITDIKLSEPGTKIQGCPKSVSFADGPDVTVVDNRRIVTFKCKGTRNAAKYNEVTYGVQEGFVIFEGTFHTTEHGVERETSFNPLWDYTYTVLKPADSSNPEPTQNGASTPTPDDPTYTPDDPTYTPTQAPSFAPPTHN
jgi:hypothetical protein